MPPTPPAAVFQVPAALTIPRLRRLAFHVGSPMTARKAELKAGIEAAVQSQAAADSGAPCAVADGSAKPKKTRAGGGGGGGAKNKPAPAAATALPRRHIVVSIDMGIRNFAVCVLASGAGAGAKQTAAAARHARACVTDMARPLWTSTPQVLVWRKYDLLELFKGPAEATAAVRAQLPLDEQEGAQPSTALKVTDFATADIPALAVRVVQDIILPLSGVAAGGGAPQTVRADRVLIEHQRHRSRGVMSVLHTTVLVNALEVSLHTLLHGMREFGFASLPAGAGAPVPRVPPTHLLDPRKVSEFWVRDMDQALDEANARKRRARPRRKRSASASAEIYGADVIDEEQGDSDQPDDESPLKGPSRARPTTLAIKRAKIGVLTRWLEAGALDLATPEAHAVAAKFLPAGAEKQAKAGARAKGKTKSKAEAKEPELKKPRKDAAAAARARKMDDLADCILQGLYALRIDENRRAMLAWDVEPFLEE
ncbi:hypothetical protein BROUX41_001874 [Berkeleyomyces rouxiae]